MSKCSCFLLFVVIASLSAVHVTKAQGLLDNLRPVIVACSEKYGVTDAEIQAAKEAGTVASIKPCFVGCVMKKTGLINDKGDYDSDTGLKNLRPLIKEDENYNKFAEIVKACSTVKDKPVTDGTAGCERSVLLADCFLEHKVLIFV